MRILIAGATGAIGRPLVRRLRAKQDEVFADAIAQFRPRVEANRRGGGGKNSTHGGDR